MFQQPAEPTDFEKRRAFQEFQKIVTPELMIEISEDHIHHRFSESAMQLIHLIGIFKHESVQFFETKPPEPASEHDLFFVGATKRRDAEFMKLIGAEMFEPESQEDNPAYYRKIKEIATGTAPRALHAV